MESHFYKGRGNTDEITIIHANVCGKNVVRIFPSGINSRPDKEQGKSLWSHCAASHAELHLSPMTGARGSQETAPDAWKREVDS